MRAWPLQFPPVHGASRQASCPFGRLQRVVGGSSASEASLQPGELILTVALPAWGSNLCTALLSDVNTQQAQLPVAWSCLHQGMRHAGPTT